MVKLYDSGVYLLNGKTLVREKDAELSLNKEEAKKGTIAYGILQAHNTSGDPENLKIKFDAITSHDLTYVGIIQTARASGLDKFPLPYVLTCCHNSLCAVGGTINEDDHVFGLSAAKKYGEPRRTSIVYPHEITSYTPEEEQKEEYPVTVFLSREGYFKKITPASLRMNSEQKFKEGDALRQSFETTSNAEAMFFTDQCQVYKTRLGEFDDAKASVLGDYLPTKLKMDAGENVIFMVLPGPDYAGSLLFFYENGKVARIEMKAYQTASNRRKLTGAYSDKSPLACIRRLDEDCELAVYSNEPRCLIFHTALLAPKTTRSAQGVAVMTLKPKYHLETVLLSEETSITNRTRYRVRAIPAAGALVKEEDSEDQQISLL